MGGLGDIFTMLFMPFMGASAANPPKTPPAPAAPAAPGPPPQVTDKAAQDAATTAGLNQAQYGGRSTILTGGAGVSGGTVRQPGLTPSSPDDSIFKKFLGD